MPTSARPRPSPLSAGLARLFRSGSGFAAACLPPSPSRGRFCAPPLQPHPTALDLHPGMSVPIAESRAGAGGHLGLGSGFCDCTAASGDDAPTTARICAWPQHTRVSIHRQRQAEDGTLASNFSHGCRDKTKYPAAMRTISRGDHISENGIRMALTCVNSGCYLRVLFQLDGHGDAIDFLWRRRHFRTLAVPLSHRSCHRRLQKTPDRSRKIE